MKENVRYLLNKVKNNIFQIIGLSESKEKGKGEEQMVEVITSPLSGRRQLHKFKRTKSRMQAEQHQDT